MPVHRLLRGHEKRSSRQEEYISGVAPGRDERVSSHLCGYCAGVGVGEMSITGVAVGLMVGTGVVLTTTGTSVAVPGVGVGVMVLSLTSVV